MMKKMKYNALFQYVNMTYTMFKTIFLFLIVVEVFQDFDFEESFTLLFTFPCLLATLSTMQL